MSVVRFSLVAVNTVLFVGLLYLSLGHWRRETSSRTRRIWLIVSLVTGALVFGSLQRVLVQASLIGWLPGTTTETVITEWQVAQSVVVGVFAVLAFLAIRSLTSSIASTERIAGTLLDRVSHIDVRSLDLSPREGEVLDRIGAGYISDAELSEVLHISASTVQTHVKSLLRKTGLNSRRDLIAVAYLREIRDK